MTASPFSSPTAAPAASPARAASGHALVDFEHHRGGQGGERDGRPERDVDLARREHEDHPDRHDRDGRGLDQDVGQVRGIQEVLGLRDREEHEDRARSPRRRPGRARGGRRCGGEVRSVGWTRSYSPFCAGSASMARRTAPRTGAREPSSLAWITRRREPRRGSQARTPSMSSSRPPMPPVITTTAGSITAAMATSAVASQRASWSSASAPPDLRPPRVEDVACSHPRRRVSRRQRVAGEHLLERTTAMVAPIERVGADRQKADLTRRAPGAPEQAAGRNDAHADAGADGDDDEVVDSASDPLASSPRAATLTSFSRTTGWPSSADRSRANGVRRCRAGWVRRRRCPPHRGHLPRPLRSHRSRRGRPRHPVPAATPPPSLPGQPHGVGRGHGRFGDQVSPDRRDADPDLRAAEINPGHVGRADHRASGCRAGESARHEATSSRRAGLSRVS